ncbi:MAG: nitroreductase [Bacillota bacterium]|nr:nitroreductase [Bacillota bacterium]
MELRQALETRKSVRGYLDKPVPKEIIEDILRQGQRAVSANNTQPWEFAVITGDILKKIGEENVASFVAGEELDYPDWPFEGVYRTRSIGIAKQLFAAMDIARENKEKRFWWMQRGFRFFDAPCAIIMYMDETLNESACRLDMGCCAQNICLAAMEHGLGTCVEDQAIMYQKALRKHLGLEGKRFVVGIAIGYEDPDFPANGVISEREDLENIAGWYGFDE